MLSNILTALRIALQNIRANLLHTMLSTLGIVIGVAALVAILSLADGMEQFARDQITRTTSLNSIIVSSQTQKRVNGILVNVDDYPIIQPQHARDLHSQLDLVDQINISYQGGTIINHTELGELGVQYYAIIPEFWTLPDSLLINGRTVDQSDFEQERKVVVINDRLARKVAPDSSNLASILGTPIPLFGTEYEVVGVGKSSSQHLQAMMTTRVLPDSLLSSKPATMVITAKAVEAVDGITSDIEQWAASTYGNKASLLTIRTNEARLDQAKKGMLVFRIVMGLITGISVLVGGIGIMNVLLISVTERTSEIGIRKAMGAKKRDIMMQFLSESVTISAFGSSLGVLLGFGFMMIAVPLIRYLTEVQFHAAYTLSTIGIVAVIALIIGVLFGTYPAARAAQQAPIEAIRRE